MTTIRSDVAVCHKPTLTFSTARLLVIDVPARQVTALRECAEQRHVQVTAIDADACTAEAFASHRPHVALVPIWRLSAVAPLALAAGVPVVALNLRAQAVDWTLSLLHDVAAITAVDIVSDPRATLDTALRVAARARTDGGTALVLPGPAEVLEDAHRIAQSLGLRTVACRTMASFAEMIGDVAPLLVFVGPWLDDQAVAVVLEFRHTHRFALVCLGADDRASVLTADVVLPRTATLDESTRQALDLAVDAVRRARVLADRHAATNLLLPRPMAAATDARFSDGDAPAALSLAVIRENGEPRDDAHALWAAECRRVSVLVRRAFPDALIGYDEDDSLVIAVAAAAPMVEQFVRTMLPSQPGVSWFAGIADSSETRARDYNYLRACAREALVADDVAIVRLWQRDTAQWTPEVVIVEPDTLLSEMLQYGLRNMGHSCRAIDTGSDALELLRRMPPTARPVLVITDVELAGVDGHSLHERLRVERPGAFEFVFLTNHGSEGEQLRALDAGARDYLIKPISVRVLLARLTRLLSTR